MKTVKCTNCEKEFEDDDAYELLMQTKLWRAYNEEADEIV